MIDTSQEETTAAAIRRMPFEELVLFLVELDSFTSVSVCTALTQRFYEIALYDNHVSTDVREAAWRLLETVKATVEDTLKSNPAALVTYKQANVLMESKVRMFGVGSLAWLIEENGVAKAGEAALIAFLSRPEYRDLLDDFYSVVGPETAARLRDALA